MLERICYKTSEIILLALESQVEVKDGIISDPQTYYSVIHRLSSGVLGIVSAHNFCSPFSDMKNLHEVFGCLKDELGADCIFVKNSIQISKDEARALEDFLSWFRTQAFEKVDLSDLYELMLSLDFPLDDNGFDKTHNQEIENTIGAFYTPKPLADKCVELAMNTYIFQNTGIPRFSHIEKTHEQKAAAYSLLTGSSFADHCCGTGSFLQAILRFLKRHFKSDHRLLQKAVCNMVAIEADALALEIAKLEVLTAINRIDLYSELSENFIHGNPLLKPRNISSDTIFSDTFYYHNGLALAPDRLKKCDVILGNPPWVEVGFDYDFFFHTLYPKLKEIEDEQELYQAVFDLEFSHPKLYEWFIDHESANDIAEDLIYNDNRFQHSFMGGLNTNLLFTELADSLCTERGSVALMLNGATLSDPTNRKLHRHLKERKRIVSRYDLMNTHHIFNIDAHEEFTVLLLGKNDVTEYAHFKGLTDLNQIDSPE